MSAVLIIKSSNQITDNVKDKDRNSYGIIVALLFIAIIVERAWWCYFNKYIIPN